MDGEYENPEGASGRRIVLSGRPFLFGDFFFGPAKKKPVLSLSKGYSAAAADEDQRFTARPNNVHGSPPGRRPACPEHVEGRG
jgi:hypothetical protein